MASAPCYGPRLIEAARLAAESFRDRRRKGSSIPYVSHLWQVAAWVAEYGGDEDQMIAGLLHDYLEDIDGADPGLLEERFGPRVRALVEALSDSTGQPRPPWRDRKERFLESLRAASPDVRLVCACDKLHNAESIVRDHAEAGPRVWTRFTAGRDGTLWYYRAVLAALTQGWAHPILRRLRAAVEALEALE